MTRVPGGGRAREREGRKRAGLGRKWGNGERGIERESRGVRMEKRGEERGGERVEKRGRKTGEKKEGGGRKTHTVPVPLTHSQKYQTKCSVRETYWLKSYEPQHHIGTVNNNNCRRLINSRKAHPVSL